MAELGLRALTETNLQALLDEAVALAAQTLETDYCEIAQLLPGGEEVMMRAGVGWEEGLVGSATVCTGLDSQVGYTLLSGEPVIVEDLPTETRFTPSPVLPEHGVVSGITVVIHHQDEPFGVLSAYIRSHRAFSEDDANSLQGVANVLAMAIEREEAQEKIEEAREAERAA